MPRRLFRRCMLRYRRRGNLLARCGQKRYVHKARIAMSALPNSKAAPGNDESQCLTRSVLSALKEDPTLEAVTIDRGRKTISVATLGKTDIPKVAERIRDTFQRAQASRAQRRCELLAGDGQCDNCNQPLSELQRQKITIQ